MFTKMLRLKCFNLKKLKSLFIRHISCDFSFTTLFGFVLLVCVKSAERRKELTAAPGSHD